MDFGVLMFSFPLWSLLGFEDLRDYKCRLHGWQSAVILAIELAFILIPLVGCDLSLQRDVV